MPELSRRTGWHFALALVAAATLGRAAASWGLDAPWIAPDEPTYGLLGRSLWASGHLTILGVDAPFYGIVYPALAGLPLHAFDTAGGIHVLKVAQALLMCSTGLVVFAWARSLVSTRHAIAATVLALALPAFTYTGLLMTEAAYYPIATVALWAMAHAIQQPTLERQAIAVTAILVTALTRLQGLALLPALVAAVVTAALFERSTRLLRRFALTLGLTLVAGALVLALHQTGGSGDLLGAYSTTQTSYQLGPALRWIVWHAADVFLLVAGIPLLAFALLAVEAACGRERDAAARALLAVGASYLVVSVVQVGAFASRFTGALAERNLITVAPPLFIALALWLARGAPRPQPTTVLVCLGVAVVALVLQTRTLTDTAGRQSTLTAAPFDHVLAWTSAGWVRAVWTIAVVAVIACFLVLPRHATPALAGLSAGLLIGISAVASVDVHRLARGLEHQLFGDATPSWVDRASGGSAAYLDGGGHYWNASWMNVFWNDRIDRVVALAGADVGPIPPHDLVSPRFDGILFTPAGTPLDEQYVVAPDRFLLVGTPVRSIETTTDVGRITLWRVVPPARLAMLRTGLQPNGDIIGNASIEVFSCGPGRLDVTILGKDGSPVLLGVEGGVTRRYSTAGQEVVHASVPSPAQAHESTRCRFFIDTPGLVGTTTITFVPESS